MVIETTLQLGAQSRKQGFVVTYFFNHSYFLLGRIKEEGEAPLLAHYKHYFWSVHRDAKDSASSVVLFLCVLEWGDCV